MKNDGGPAFPRPASEFTGSGTCPDGNDPIRAQNGMSLRDYFAAHAPHEPQFWFKPIMQSKCPETIWDRGMQYENYPTNEREIQNWRDEYDKQRFIQWPMAWADAMLTARES